MARNAHSQLTFPITRLPNRRRCKQESNLEFPVFAWNHFKVPKEPSAWPHAPTHQLSTRGTYFVTAGTYLKHHHFRDATRLDVLQRGLLKLADSFGWRIEAWAVFSNHYHYVAHSPEIDESAESLSTMVNELHKKTATWVNQLDGTRGRIVWHNYWDTKLTHHRSYLARLNYVHQNAVRHGLVRVANEYPWCTARWFERTTSAAQVKSIYRFRTEKVNVFDEFEPEAVG